MPQHISDILVRVSPRRSSESKGSKPARTNRKNFKSQRGTVLHAVPPADTLQPPVAPFRCGVANSPDTPIMSAISERRIASTLLPPYVFPGQLEIPFRRSNPNSPVEQRKDSACKVGVWRDGVAHWNVDAREKARIESLVDKDADAFLDWPVTRPLSDCLSDHSSRPNLSIVIPESHFQKVAHTTRTHTPLAQTQTPAPASIPERKRSASMADVSAVSKFNMAAQALSCRGITLIESVPLSLSALVSPLNEQQLAIISRSEDEPSSTQAGPSRSTSLSGSTNRTEDDASCYSEGSSRTSFESEQRDKSPITKLESNLRPIDQGHEKTISNAFSIMSPLQAGVFDEPSQVDLNKPLPPSPIFNPSRKSQIHPSITHRRQSRTVKPSKSVPDTLLNERLGSKKSCRSLYRLEAFDEEFMKTNPGQTEASAPASPTFSEAETDLRIKLRDIREVPPLMIAKTRKASKQDSKEGKDTTSGEEAAISRAPTIPSKSRRREWKRRVSEQTAEASTLVAPGPPNRRRSASDVRRESAEIQTPIAPLINQIRQSSSDHDLLTLQEDDFIAELAPPPRLTVLSVHSARMSILIPTIPIDDGLIPIEIENDNQRIQRVPIQHTPRAAELVLLRIMGSLPSLDDLASVAVINKGMRRVYKQNELSVVQSVHKNMSPSSWELRQWSPPLSVVFSADMEPRVLDYTPASYTRGMRQDAMVLEDLKRLIIDRCESFLRPVTVAALSSKTDQNTSRFDEAFNRIWCFCKIFGGDKGREDDITGQLDWLKGGLLAHQQGCAATVNTNLEYDMCSVLLNAPDHFAKCNERGMSADDLYDITELWNCLSALLQGYQGRVEQARANGIYTHADVPIGDMEKEEMMLEEWLFYILSIGPQAVLELARLSTDRSEAGFELARKQGWTDWTTAISTGSRSTFLKEPVARLYEERIVTVAVNSMTKIKALEKKEHSRKRVAGLAAEIRRARCSSSYKRLPLIDMSQERPWSVMSRRSSMASAKTVTSVASSRRPMSPPPPTATANSMSRMLSGTWSPRKVGPIIEERAQPYDRMSYHSMNSVVGSMVDDTADRAVKRIVDMGFTVEQAKTALKMTDMGHGLNLDGAVEILLR